MKGLPPRFAGLFLLISVVLAACTPQETVRISPSPTAPPATSAPATTVAASRTPSPAPTSASPSPSPTPAPTTSPGSTPPTACAPLTGGGQTNATATLHDIRVAHHPGYDRLVFEFNGTQVPQYRIEVANSFQAPSGLPVTVSGNAFFQVRFQGAAAHFDTGGTSYTGPNPVDANLPILRQVKLIEDFEAVLRWGVGLERLACPTVQTLTGPVRVVIDFPTP